MGVRVIKEIFLAKKLFGKKQHLESNMERDCTYHQISGGEQLIKSKLKRPIKRESSKRFKVQPNWTDSKKSLRSRRSVCLEESGPQRTELERF